MDQVVLGFKKIWKQYKILKLFWLTQIHRFIEAWKERFHSYDEVIIENDYFENLPEFDCMVSAANSFGLMDGGGRWGDNPFFWDGSAIKRSGKDYQRILGGTASGKLFYY